MYLVVKQWKNSALGVGDSNHVTLDPLMFMAYITVFNQTRFYILKGKNALVKCLGGKKGTLAAL